MNRGNSTDGIEGSLADEEISALVSIYQDKFRVSIDPVDPSCKCVSLEMFSCGGNISYGVVSVNFSVIIPSGYPGRPFIPQLNAPRGLTDGELSDIYSKLEQLLHDSHGTPMLCSAFHLVQEALDHVDKPSEPCPICLLEYHAEDNVIRIHCGHNFHQQCLGLAFLQQKEQFDEAHEYVPPHACDKPSLNYSCPVCRAVVELEHTVEAMATAQSPLGGAQLEEFQYHVDPAQQAFLESLWQRQLQNGGIIQEEAPDRWLVTENTTVHETAALAQEPMEVYHGSLSQSGVPEQDAMASCSYHQSPRLLMGEPMPLGLSLPSQIILPVISTSMPRPSAPHPQYLPSMGLYPAYAAAPTTRMFFTTALNEYHQSPVMVPAAPYYEDVPVQAEGPLGDASANPEPEFILAPDETPTPQPLVQHRRQLPSIENITRSLQLNATTTNSTTKTVEMPPMVTTTVQQEMGSTALVDFQCQTSPSQSHNASRDNCLMKGSARVKYEGSTMHKSESASREKGNNQNQAQVNVSHNRSSEKDSDTRSRVYHNTEIPPRFQKSKGLRCYNCNGVGHKSHDCPNQVQGSSGTPQGPQCYNCHGVGHLARDCPKKQHSQNFNHGEDRDPQQMEEKSESQFSKKQRPHYGLREFSHSDRGKRSDDAGACSYNRQGSRGMIGRHEEEQGHNDGLHPHRQDRREFDREPKSHHDGSRSGFNRRGGGSRSVLGAGCAEQRLSKT